MFAFYIFIWSGCLLQMCAGKMRVLVHEYCRILVSLYCQDPFYLGYKSRCWQYKLVYWYQLAWSYRRLKLFVFFLLVLRFLGIDLLYSHALQSRTGKFSNLLSIIPIRDIICSLHKKRCPHGWWYRRISEAVVVGCLFFFFSFGPASKVPTLTHYGMV